MTLTLAVRLAFLSSLTVNLNTKVVSEDMLEGAVKVAIGELALSNLTTGVTGAVCVHR